MAKGKRETDEERAARDREERIALLKMKQGLIEESEIIPETGYGEPLKENVLQRLSSFVYRNKVFVILGVFFAVIAAVIIYQFATHEKEDLHVLLVAYDENSTMMFYSESIAEALEQYCPDFDGNGRVHVTVNFINRSRSAGGSQYDDIQRQRLTSELEYGTAMLIITDEGFVESVNFEDKSKDEQAMRSFFLPQTDKFGEDELFCGVGIRANKTKLPGKAEWKDCPDNVIIAVRAESDNKTSNDEQNAIYRERAEIVLENIVNNKAAK